MDLFKSLRNFIFSGIISNPMSRKIINKRYNRLTLEQKGRYYTEFAKIFNVRSFNGQNGYWELSYQNKLIQIPLNSGQFWLDWDIALSVLGHEIEIIKTYEALLNSSMKPEIFVDIGANYGLHSLLFLVHKINTISFEPNDYCVNYFVNLCKANQITPNI